MMSKPRLVSLTCVSSLLLLAGCSANPGPAPVEEAAPGTATATSTMAQSASKEFTIGIDEVAGGLNPHLGSADSVFVRELANLVLPSAFFDGQAEHMNPELLQSAELITPAANAAQTIRYVLNPEAQWSDGTPITVADFQYLWQAIVHNADTKLAAYYAPITSIRSSHGGRTIEVDLQAPVAQWQQLFQHLLPAHALGDPIEDFAKDLNSGYPASGWRYQLRSYDQQRGLITVDRNDRFWGATPTTIPSIEFVEIRSLNQGADMLRSGQVEALNIMPTPTAQELFELIPGTRVATSTTDITWQLIPTTQLTLEQRQRLASLLDVPVIRRLATELDSAEPESVEVTEPGADLPQPLRIGVNPEDTVARSAARIIIDMLAQAGVPANVVESDATQLFGTLVPDGEVDVVLARNAYGVLERTICTVPASAAAPTTDARASASSTAGEASQTPEDRDSGTQDAAAPASTATATDTADTASSAPDTPATSAASEGADPPPEALAPGRDNFSRWCDPALAAPAAEYLAGTLPAAAFEDLATQREAEQLFRIPLVVDTRLSVLGSHLGGSDTGPIPFESLGALIAWQEQQENA